MTRRRIVRPRNDDQFLQSKAVGELNQSRFDLYRCSDESFAAHRFDLGALSVRIRIGRSFVRRHERVANSHVTQDARMLA